MIHAQIRTGACCGGFEQKNSSLLVISFSRMRNAAHFLICLYEWMSSELVSYALFKVPVIKQTRDIHYPFAQLPLLMLPE